MITFILIAMIFRKSKKKKKYVKGLPWPFIENITHSMRLALYVSHTPTREKDHAMTL